MLESKQISEADAKNNSTVFEINGFLCPGKFKELLCYLANEKDLNSHITLQDLHSIVETGQYNTRFTAEHHSVAVKQQKELTEIPIMFRKLLRGDTQKHMAYVTDISNLSRVNQIFVYDKYTKKRYAKLYIIPDFSDNENMQELSSDFYITPLTNRGYSLMRQEVAELESLEADGICACCQMYALSDHNGRKDIACHYMLKPYVQYSIPEYFELYSSYVNLIPII